MVLHVWTSYFCETCTVEYEVLTLLHGNCCRLQWDW